MMKNIKKIFVTTLTMMMVLISTISVNAAPTKSTSLNQHLEYAKKHTSPEIWENIENHIKKSEVCNGNIKDKFPLKHSKTKNIKLKKGDNFKKIIKKELLKFLKTTELKPNVNYKIYFFKDKHGLMYKVKSESETCIIKYLKKLKRIQVIRIS